MANKQISFSGNQLIVNETAPFKIADFKAIKSTDEVAEIVQISSKKKETLKISVVSKSVFDGRFVAVYFNEGEKYPYVDKVKTVSSGVITEKINPRDSEDIEMRSQFIIMIDVVSQRIWLSDQRKKSFTVAWLKEKLGVEVEIKSVINEGDLLEKLESVSEIHFSVVPSIFSQIGQNTLASELVEDLYGFDAEKVSIKMHYDNKKITDKVQNKIKSILGKKQNFDDICVIGRSDDNLETIFNTEGIVSKLVVTVPEIKETKLYNETEAFRALMMEIKKHD